MKMYNRININGLNVSMSMAMASAIQNNVNNASMAGIGSWSLLSWLMALCMCSNNICISAPGHRSQPALWRINVINGWPMSSMQSASQLGW